MIASAGASAALVFRDERFILTMNVGKGRAVDTNEFGRIGSRSHQAFNGGIFVTIEGGLNVRDTEALARKAAGGEARARSAPTPQGKDADTLALENDLAEMLGLEVEIFDRGGSGELRVRYASLEQLDEICRRLSKA